VEAIAAVLNARLEVSSAAKLTLVGLANHCGPDGEHAWPSVARLARYAQVTPRQVQRHLRDLEEAGLVQITQKEGRYRGREYRIVLPAVMGDADVTHGAAMGDTGDAIMGDVSVTRTEDPQDRNRQDQVAPPEAIRLCNLMAEAIEAGGDRRPTVTKAWVEAADRLTRLDGYEDAEVERVLRWALADDFWSANVLSMTTFRRKFPMLRRQSLRHAGTDDAHILAEMERIGRDLGA
jgi:DNA-binding transcriptional ArsR family regulator